MRTKSRSLNETNMEIPFFKARSYGTILRIFALYSVIYSLATRIHIEEYFLAFIRYTKHM